MDLDQTRTRTSLTMIWEKGRNGHIGRGVVTHCESGEHGYIDESMPQDLYAVSWDEINGLMAVGTDRGPATLPSFRAFRVLTDDGPTSLGCTEYRLEQLHTKQPSPASDVS